MLFKELREQNELVTNALSFCFMQWVAKSRRSCRSISSTFALRQNFLKDCKIGRYVR